ncbi:MAG: flagellar export chaperone FlgN [Candidatus Scalindua sediminis]|nr:flagellar export chaperone FlgN [Candidatus Scalindua sediminis]HDY69165.1 hypothetical protein [Candidatus Scalindua sp.]
MTKDKIQMPNQNEEAITYLKSKLEHYESLLRLAKKQEEAIKSCNIKELNSLITKKENHIKNIKRLEKLNPKSLLSDIRFDSLLKQLRSIITKIVNHDQDSISLLSLTIDSIKTKASNLNKKIRRVKSSRMQQIRAPRFIDVVQ